MTATTTAPYVVDEHPTGLAGWRCRLRPCHLPYAGPYGSRATAEKVAEAHAEQHHKTAGQGA